MSDSPLERVLPVAERLGTGTVRDDVAAILVAHGDVFPTVGRSAEAIASAVDLIVRALSAGGRLIYAGAGTSGWLAALDAAEVVVTYGMTGRVDAVVAGGRTLDPIAMTLGDDDVDSLAEDEVMAGCGPGDTLIAVSASGRTPFTLAAARGALVSGANLISIVNVEDSPLAQLAHVAIVVPIPGEVVAGSTRLTAGLAQKLVLNTLSTVSMVRLGRVLRGQMVCVEPLNEKLRRRIAVAVAVAADVDTDTAAAAVAEAGRGDVATVALVAGIEVSAARTRLDKHHGDINRAIADSQGALLRY